jgi:DNA modification methylase
MIPPNDSDIPPDFSPQGENRLTPEERAQYILEVRLYNRDSLDSALEQGWRLIRLNLHYTEVEAAVGMSYSTARRKINLVTDPRRQDPEWIKPINWRPCSLILEMCNEKRPGLFEAIKNSPLNDPLVSEKQIEQFVALFDRKQVVDAWRKESGLYRPLLGGGCSLLNSVTCGDCRGLMKKLPPKSVDLIIMSPPYGNQMEGRYPGVDPDVYAAWFVDVMNEPKRILKDHGSVIVVIRAHVVDGDVHPYVEETITALRRAGWVRPGEIIWHKPNGGPCGSIKLARENFEHVLWFGLRGQRPYVDVKALGKFSKRLGLVGGNRHGLFAGQSEPYEGIARIPDVLVVPTLKSTIDHPAMFPPKLVDVFVQTYSKPGDTILDMFAGSGTTCLVAKKRGRNWIGFDVVQKFVNIANERLAADVPDVDLDDDGRCPLCGHRR